jgi:parallel beta-helix repeat protein
MAAIIEDRVREVTTSTGTGNMTLAGAAVGYRTFASVCAANDTFEACIVAVDASGNPTGDWEVSKCTFVNASTISRTTVRSSSNANQLVNFGAGTKQIFLTLSAHQIKQFATVTAPTTPPPSNILPVPTGIGDNQVITLQAGVKYIGTLNMSGRTGVRVVASGLPKPILTNGQAVTGWTLHSGNIYKASIGFQPNMVSVDRAPVHPAHYPSRDTRFLTSNASDSDTVLRYNFPPAASNNMVGGRCVVLINVYELRERPITAYDNAGAITLGGDVDGSGTSKTSGVPFYVQGKLWMLSESNSWAYENGFLYVWTADGQSPATKEVWASQSQDGINASSSTNCKVSGVEIFGVGRGINAEQSTGFEVYDTDIYNSERDGVWASGSSGLQVGSCKVVDSFHTGINGFFGSNDMTVKNCTVINSGMVGMPKRALAGIFIGFGANNSLIKNNTVINSCYHGISVNGNTNSTIACNTIDKACVVCTDGGGIYTQSPEKYALNMIIDHNVVKNVTSSQGHGIYLDDFSNNVKVTNNYVENCSSNILLHSAHHNVISNNTLVGLTNTTVAQIVFAQATGTISNNIVENNDITSHGTNTYTYKLEVGENLATFATYNFNTYRQKTAERFARTWTGSPAVDHTFSSWKSYVGSDANSVYIQL